MTTSPMAVHVADWAAGIDGARLAPGRPLARVALEDALACLVAGAGDRAAHGLRTALAPHPQGGASVAGAGVARFDPATAALANGTAAHALDYDDVLVAGGNHPGAVLTAALLALAEARGLDDTAFLDAFTVGLHVQVALAMAVMPAHYRAGWHTTSTLGTLGAAVACARLLGLDAAGVRRALCLSFSMAGGTKVQFGTAAKPLHAGLAAQHGVQAALMAQAGLDGHVDALDGRFGFAAMMGEPGVPARWDATRDVLSATAFDPAAVRLVFKRYPCCGSAGRALDVLLELRERHGLRPADVARIDVGMGDINVQNLMYPRPVDALEARFSMHYTAAVALATGQVGLADFAPGAVDRPAIRALLPRVHLHSFGDAVVAGRPDQRRPHTVRVECVDGRVLEGACEHPRGSTQNPFSEAERRAKLADCTGWVLDDARQAALRAAMVRLGEGDGVEPLAAALRFACGGDDGERFSHSAASAATGVQPEMAA